MKLVAVAESLEPRDGWGSYSLGLLRGLGALGLEPTVLLARESAAEGLPNTELLRCLTPPLQALANPVATVRDAVQVRRHTRQADLLHIMVEPYAAAALPIGLPPTVVTIHGTYAVAPFRQRRHTRWLYAAALRRARSVVCVSSFTRERLLESLKLDNATVIPNGHELLPDNGQAAREQLIVDGRPLILGVGALKARKGYHVALRAVARLRERFPDLRYYLIGDDSDRKYVDRLRQDIASLGLQRHAVLTGAVSDTRLRSFYRQADLFLLTPVNVGRSFEGFGIVYLEAGAHGKPVVGSSGCGAEEAVQDGVNGLLAPQGDDAAVAERAAAILADPALAARLGAAGRARAERQTWAAVARRYLALYEQALGPRGEG